MALRTAVSADPAPSVPMSRSAVNPAIRSSRAASVATIVRCGNGFLDGLQVLGAGVQKEVVCGVDQPGQQSSVAEIDDFSALRMGYLGTHFHDAISADEDFGRADHAAGFDIQQARGMNDSRRLRGSSGKGEQEQGSGSHRPNTTVFNSGAASTEIA